MTLRAPSLVPCIAVLSAQALLWCAAAPASAQVAVLRVDPAAEALCAALESALTDADLVADPGYFAQARDQGLDPSAPATFEMLIPLLGLRLAVVPLSADEQSVQVELRDGRTGASLGGAAIPLDRGLLGFVGRHTLRREVFRRLGGPPAEGGAQQAPEVEESSDEPAAEAADTERTLVVQLVGGFGAGMRTLDWPAEGELLGVETGWFAAYELDARFAFRVSESFTLGPELSYQSSLAHEIRETHEAAPAENVGIRSHRFASLLVATFGEADGLQVAPALGYGARNLRPEVHHLLTPSYSIAGPIARVALRLALGESVALQLAPEAQWVLVGDELEAEGVQATGVGVGGEASLTLAFSGTLAIELGYREAHALLSAAEGSATDVERFVTTRLRWSP
jgi:hypothetical protein